MRNDSVMFIAGDPSGDQHASPVIKELRHRLPSVKMWGIGGPSMQSEGFVPSMPFAPFNRMGFLEVAIHIAFFLKAKKFLAEQLRLHRPGALVCVDYPGFNMMMIKIAKALDIPVIWYIAPMVWAWKRKRAEVLGNTASHIAVIFPFEMEYFKNYKAHVVYAGNPLMEAMEREGRFTTDNRKGPDDGTVRLAIVPGSRVQEIGKLLAPMLGAHEILKKRFPKIQATVSKCPFVPMETYVKASGGLINKVEVFEGNLRDLLQKSDLALVTSGTATLEAALMGVPMVLAYKTSRITYAIAKAVIQIPFIGLPNIIANAPIIPECIQDKVTAAGLAALLSTYLENPDEYRKTRDSLLQLRGKLGYQHPAESLVNIIVDVLSDSQPPR
jgi:lipid-A-disaccharide synthase